MPDGTPAARGTQFRPLFPEALDQGDPFVLALPPETGDEHRYVIYTTGEEPVGGRAFPVYGSPDLVTWERLGESLITATDAAHWAPCVRYTPELPRPYVMLYSRSRGPGEEAHVGHVLWRADSLSPVGPFTDTGPLAMPEYDFAIDPDVYRGADGALLVAFAVDFVVDEPYGTGLVEAAISDDLRSLMSPVRPLARPVADWHVYEPARVMPWKQIPGIDWDHQTVRWHTMEAPVGGLVSPAGNRVYLYSGGCFWNFYAIGALIETDGQLDDVSRNDTALVLAPDPEAGFFAPGHCSLLPDVDGTDYVVFHARFGSVTAKRQMCLARLAWDAAGHPRAVPLG